MSRRSAFSAVLVVLSMGVAPGVAQDKLGDLVAAGGYEWFVGKWVATADDGQKVEFNIDWVLDKYALFNSLQTKDIKYQGLITLSPTGQEATDQGVDNRGGTWKGTWSADGDGLVRKIEHLGPDGQTRKGEMLITKGDADTITIALYATDSNGSRNAEPVNKLTYKRQQAQGLPNASSRVGDPKAAPASAPAEASGRATDYEKLGDIVSSGGYEWLIGKWTGTENNKTYELEYKPILDKHGASVDMKIGEFKYLGMITYVTSRQEIVEFGADTLGRTWKMVWQQEGSDLINKTELTKPDGTTQKLQHVFTKIDNDAFKAKLYAVGADGSRASEPSEQVTFKRQKPAAQTK
jgi:hypothetical protein